MSNQNEVLIVGAGPVGLSAALALAKAKIPIRIIDRFLAAGVKIHGACIYAPGNVLLVRPSFDHLPTPYPFMLGLEQFKTEALLTQPLKAAGVEVERGVELLNFNDARDRVSVRLKHHDGNETVEEFNYLLGSDGAHSTVRAGLGLTL